MKVLGVHCYADRFEWALVEGADRASATVIESGKEQVPPSADRGAELKFVRTNITAIVTRYSPNVVAVRKCEASAARTKRCEVDGVVLEALSSAACPTKSIYAATLRSSFGTRTKGGLEQATEAIAAVADTAKTRRSPVITAVSQFPKP